METWVAGLPLISYIGDGVRIFLIGNKYEKYHGYMGIMLIRVCLIDPWASSQLRRPAIATPGNQSWHGPNQGDGQNKITQICIFGSLVVTLCNTKVRSDLSESAEWLKKHLVPKWNITISELMKRAHPVQNGNYRILLSLRRLWHRAEINKRLATDFILFASHSLVQQKITWICLSQLC